VSTAAGMETGGLEGRPGMGERSQSTQYGGIKSSAESQSDRKGLLRVWEQARTSGEVEVSPLAM
jgi:hypothetical protein